MYVFKACLIGFCIAAPVGPIGMLCIQRALAYGFGPALAAAAADALYGLLGALGVAGLVKAMPALTLGLQVLGGAFLVWMGVGMLRAAGAQANAAPAMGRRRAFASTFLLTLSNPMTILSFVAVFAALGAPAAGGAGPLSLMVAGVFAGSAAWWLLLSGFTAALRARFDGARTRWMTRAAGLAVTAFGLWQAAAGAATLM